MHFYVMKEASIGNDSKARASREVEISIVLLFLGSPDVGYSMYEMMRVAGMECAELMRWRKPKLMEERTLIAFALRCVDKQKVDQPHRTPSQYLT